MRYRINLKAEREKRNMTQANLAKLIGVTEKSISKWESGRGQPCYENMLKICKEFNIDINKVDSKAIVRNRINTILNGCLILVNLIIVIIVLVCAIKIQNGNILTPDLSMMSHLHHSGANTTIVANRLKIWMMMFVVVPVFNLLVPIVLRKHVVISACIAIINIAFCMFVFKNFASDIFHYVGLACLFIIVVIICFQLKTNKKIEENVV